MKIGVFSDVHGHLEELQKTLRLFEEMGVDEILCCGDMVDKGQHSDDVVTVMRQRNIPCVQGNHDLKAQFRWITEHETLSPDSIAYLSMLLPTISLERMGVNLFLCHANPWQDSSVYVFPDRPEALFHLVVDAVDADIVIMGHTHHAMCVYVAECLLINPGSVYGNRDRQERTCGILSLPDKSFNLYDIDTGEELLFNMSVSPDFQFNQKN